MDRAFAIAPTASCSYRYKDRAGYTTAPELAPPIGRTVDRDSSTFGVQTFDYGDVETAEEVGGMLTSVSSTVSVRCSTALVSSTATASTLV